MFLNTKMKVIYIIEIFLIALLFTVKSSLAHPGHDIKKHSKNHIRYKEFADLTIENNVLNGIKKPLDGRKFGQVIYDALKENPEHVAQIDAQTGKQTTYKEMMDRSIRLALWMKKQGIDPNDTIVVCTHNHLDAYIPVFATFFVDAVFNAWNEDFTPYTMQRLAILFTPKMIFTNENAADKLLEVVNSEKSNSKLVVFGKHSKMPSLSDIIDAQTQDEVNNFKLVNKKSPQGVAAVILSSGNSGFPKGSMLPNNLLLPPDAPNISPKAVIRYLWYSSLEWISGLLFTFKTITTKGTRIIPAPNDTTDGFFKTVEKYKVNYVLIPLSVIHDVAKSGLDKKYDLHSLKMILTAGSKIAKKILLKVKKEFPSAFVGQAYGMTEAGGILSFTKTRSKHIDSAGIVAPNCRVKIVDTNSGETLGPYKNGELCTETPSMMIGYYKNPNKTRAAFDAEGWYHSKDLAYFDESGEIFIVDRLKEIIKYKNNQISPQEIEEVLMSHSEIQEAAVVSISVGLNGDRPVAFIKKAPGTKVTKDEVMKFTSVLEDYKQLKEVYFMDNLPHLPSGKIARAELKELAAKFSKNKHEK